MEQADLRELELEGCGYMLGLGQMDKFLSQVRCGESIPKAIAVLLTTLDDSSETSSNRFGEALGVVVKAAKVKLPKNENDVRSVYRGVLLAIHDSIKWATNGKS